MSLAHILTKKEGGESRTLLFLFQNIRKNIIYEKYFTFTTVVFILLVSFCSLVSAQGTDATEFPGGFVLYHYQDKYLDFSLIHPERWINQFSQEKVILIYLPDFKGTLTFHPVPLFGAENNLLELA